MNILDNILNKITMYRIVLYGLIVLAAYSLIISLLGQLSFAPIDLLILLLTLTFVCFFGNMLLGKLFRVPINAESSMITALILYFLLWPSKEIENVLIAAVAGLIAMLSKYVISYRKKHIFNPAAFAVVALILFGTGGIWWVATPIMLPATLIVGLLIVRKVRRFTLFFTFLIVSLLTLLLQAQFKGLNLFDQTNLFFTSFPVIFFGTIMLTEPLTLPPTRRLQMIYAAITGVLFSWQGSFGPIILTTELVLIFGNIFSFIVSPKYKLKLKLIQKRKLATDTFEFVFPKPSNFFFRPGQYLEWTLPILRTDGRGNRRYFTIASSPTENTIRLGIRFNKPSSVFKQMLESAQPDDHIFAGQLIGDFTLPKDTSKKIVFIAGGIGVTPFRSMIKYMLDKNEKRDIVMFYSNKTQDEIAYRDILDEAERKLSMKIIYVLTDEATVPANWTGEKGRINEEMLGKYIADIPGRIFFISGPNAMVANYKKLLKSVGVKPASIITDYFPGF